MKIARMPDGSPEIFHTLQGEGRNTGSPSVFIRSSLCNLSCSWCDTPYTWNWDDTACEHESPVRYRREEEILTLSTEEVAERASSFGCSNYVFTGGEPLLQEAAWIEVMKHLTDRESECHFEIETNGTLLPSSAFFERVHQINVSPKLRNSRVAEEARRKPDVLRQLAASGKADFKFVIEAPQDLEEVTVLIAACGIGRSNVFLMPAASTPAELEANQETVSEIARDLGFRYSDRLHLRLYGARRGV